jgi:hypothetical protein
VQPRSSGVAPSGLQLLDSALERLHEHCYISEKPTDLVAIETRPRNSESHSTNDGRVERDRMPVAGPVQQIKARILTVHAAILPDAERGLQDRRDRVPRPR